MKVETYEMIMRAQASRRSVMKGMAGAASVAAMGAATMGSFGRPASADAAFRKALLQIPGVGKGSPTDQDWQKVGEMCLGPTKANVQEGEF